MDSTCQHIKTAIKAIKAPVVLECEECMKTGDDWVHLRTSNTEPIIRIYAESNFETTANNIALRLMQDIKEFI